ncbi:MAG: hypothetical protein ACJ766_03445, partial [Thermoleophilaceae bacterium]
FERPGGGERLLGLIDERLREAVHGRQYERAAGLLRRRERLAWVLDKLEGMLRAAEVSPRLVLARHPTKERFDAFWIVRGRVADWGPLPGTEELVERTEAVLEHTPRRGPSSLSPEEVDEVRIVAGWLAEHEPEQLELDRERGAGSVAGWAQRIACSQWKPARASTSSSRATRRGARSSASTSRAS